MWLSITPTHAAWLPVIPETSSANPSAPRSSKSEVGSYSSSITLPILTYHFLEVVKEKKDKLRISMAITPTIFEKSLQDLADKHYQTIFLRGIPAMFRRTMNPASPVIALTFDDGYEDFYTDAFPLLKKYSAHATLFMISSYIDRPGFLSLKELKEINDSGLVEIGAHTVHHKNLTRISLKKAEAEIAGSKTEIEQKLGIHVDTFAYPYGKWNPKLATIVEKAGFTAAVTTERGFLQSPNTMMSLRRISAGAFMGTRKWKTIGEAARR
ncbi:MAG: polysaccharide deacetylase family protein [Candidatus Peregrinibacteria bacterium]